MFVNAIRTAKKAMFPIFRREQVSDTQCRVMAIGSGFFVNRQGVFVTVSHLFDNPNDQTSFCYWGELPDHVHNPSLIIKEIGRNDDLDVFVGKIEMNSPKHFDFLEVDPEVGQSVCISGYPMATIGVDDQGRFQLGGVRRYFQPSFILDQGAFDTDNGFGQIRKHTGFLVRDMGYFGMSGGPAFDIYGKIIGMQASIIHRVNASGNLSTVVQNAVIIKNDVIKELLNKFKVEHS
jgi:hypothetical protein